MTDDSKIPLCRSEILQDLSIELGRRFAKRNPFRSFTVEADFCDHEGDSLERLAAWASTHYGTRVALNLWENGRVWVGVRLEAAENNQEFSLNFYPDCKGFDAEGMAEAFRDTVAVSTRLCYGESPLPILRKIWKHDGGVQTKGTLKKPRKTEPEN
jgi:hypothetical protein